jgi:hypothetical protein
MRIVRIALALSFFVVVPAALADNFCMDCLQRTWQSQDVPVHYTSDAICCMLPCYGYEKYETKDLDVGFGCLTCQTNNELVSGSYCCSNSNDKNCGGGKSAWNDLFQGDNDTCSIDAQGWCPAECRTCA